MPLVNVFGGGHTQTQIHTYRRVNKNEFKKPGARHGLQPRVPGLTNEGQGSTIKHNHSTLMTQDDFRILYVPKRTVCHVLAII